MDPPAAVRIEPMPERNPEGVHGFLTRRGFVRLLGAGAAAVLLPACRDAARSVGLAPPARAHTPFITPDERFYLVAVDPSYRPPFGPREVTRRWSLGLRGLDGREARLGYDHLRERARRTVLHTFECIGNPVGGSLIGNARWRSVGLREILQRAPGGVAGARAVMFESLDGFYSSVSIERALDDYAFLALEMNGAPLPAGHGFPVRTLLPDLYGMKQPRWLKRITLLEDAATTSYWEKRGWAGEVPVKTMSRLDPRRRRQPPQALDLSGVAFAGRRGIRAVEVSLDNGAHWVRCELVTPTTPNVWSLWRYTWRAPTPGRHIVLVRAIDGTGALQTAKVQDSFPDGASGYDGLVIEVSA